MVDHRIGLYSVMKRHLARCTLEDILEQLPTLSPGSIREIIGFYQENREQVDAYVADYRAELQRQEAAYEPTPAALRIRRLVEERARTGQMA